MSVAAANYHKGGMALPFRRRQTARGCGGAFDGAPGSVSERSGPLPRDSAPNAGAIRNGRNEPAGQPCRLFSADRRRRNAMTVTVSATPSLDVSIRPLAERDLDAADHILRQAFDTFVGVPDLFGDRDLVRTRYRADPSGAIGALLDGTLVGSVFVAQWGSLGILGPLTVR
ncbi:MAG TPA: hypothetical protein VFQ80_01530, partial [Thermomicrobiales bacterium]|nr:hypothetical protein [Thermomicrobiales bacterium]